MISPDGSMTRTPRVVLLTDLDGTLLDRDGSWSPARDALDALERKRIPVIPVTSRTRVEVETLLADLGRDEPFVVESGAAVYVPAAYDRLRLDGAVAVGPYRATVLGRPHAEALDFLERCSVAPHLTPMTAMSDARIAELTGLDPDAIPATRAREYSEPFLLSDQPSLPTLRREATEAGLAIHRDGAFWHVAGAGGDKGTAVQILIDAFRASGPDEVVSIGLGNDPTDVPFLARCDYPVILPSSGDATVSLVHPEAQSVDLSGSAGWNEAVLSLLQRLDRPRVRADDRGHGT